VRWGHRAFQSARVLADARQECPPVDAFGHGVSIRARPRGRATIRDAPALANFCFNPRASSRTRDVGERILRTPLSMFQSARVLADARHTNITGGAIATEVSIRARPRGRATVPRVMRLRRQAFQSARVLADARQCREQQLRRTRRFNPRASSRTRDLKNGLSYLRQKRVSIRARPRGRATRNAAPFQAALMFQSARVLADARRVFHGVGQGVAVSIRARPRGRAT